MPDWREFDMEGIKPFFSGDEKTLANVSLRLDEGRSTSTWQDKHTFAELTKCAKAAAQLGHLPQPGEAHHCVLKGDFALFNFIDAALQLGGARSGSCW